MQRYPVREFDILAKPNWCEAVTAEWDGLVIAISPNDLDQIGIVVNQVKPPVRYITEVWIQILHYDENLKLYVTKIEDLVPLFEKFTAHKGYEPDIVMNQRGFEVMVNYNPADPTTNPMLCKDCGT